MSFGQGGFSPVGSNLRPYIDPVSFTELVTEERNIRPKFKGYFKNTIFRQANLMEEVARYAMVAGAIAQQHKFDVIHAHDWLTNHSPCAAKKVSVNRCNTCSRHRV